VYRVNIYKKINTLFSRNSKIFEEELERSKYVVEKDDDEKNFQYEPCVREIKLVGISTQLYQLYLLYIELSFSQSNKL
jgi:hypothetical protein